jgi:hypothetical protein
MTSRRPRGRRTRAQQRWIVPAALAVLAMAVLAIWLALGLSDEAGGLLAGTEPATPTPASPLAIETATPAPSEQAPAAEETVTPAQESTPTPAATPTPAPPVVIGQFGELPRPNMPQARPDLARLQLQYTLGISLDQVPTEAPAYRMRPRSWDRESVAAIARSLGIEGEVTESGSAFHVVDEAHELYISGNQIQYQQIGAAQQGGELPDDATLIAAARDWLLANDLVGEGLGAGTVTDRLEDSGLAIVVFQPVEPSPILSALPRATVTVSADGEIRQAFINWPAGFEASTYSLRDAESLWEDVLQGRGYVEIELESLPSGTNPLPATVTITGVEIAYTDAGEEGDRYLTPLVRFTGEAMLEGIDSPVPIRVSVPAVAAQAAPRG